MKAIWLSTLILTCLQAATTPTPEKPKLDTGKTEQLKNPKNPLTKSPETHINKVEPDTDILTNLNEKEQRLNEPLNESCNKELMGFFNLSGLPKPITKAYELCPNVKKSCCNDGDEGRTLEIWMSQQEGVVEKYYENYLNSMRYLLGYSQEILNLSLKFANKETERLLEIHKSIERHLMQTSAQLLKDNDTEDNVSEVHAYEYFFF
jgi:hypothetical protein